MEYSIIVEKLKDSSLPKGYYYAHIPSLDLTTHGLGIEGAKMAAQELIQLWIQEKYANQENVPTEEEAYFSTIKIDDALLST